MAEQKRALKSVKNNYVESDFNIAIDYYKERNKYDKVISLYDELIVGSPHVFEYRMEKAQYQFEQKEFAASNETLKEILLISPYDVDVFEQMADNFEKLAKKEEAIKYYKLAMKNNIFSASKSTVDKLEKVEGIKQYKNLFVTPSFNDILKDNGWKEKAVGKDALVLMFTRDIAVTEHNMVNVYQKLMIKILTDAGVNRYTQYNFGFLGNLSYIKLIKKDGSELIPDQRGANVVFKDLAPGDLIQIEANTFYSLSSLYDREFNFNHYMTLDDDIYFSKLEFALPKEKELIYTLHKVKNTLETEVKGNYRHYKWIHNNIQGFEYEEATPDRADPFANIAVSTMKDWTKVVNWYLDLTYRKTESTYEIDAILDTIITKGMSKEDKIKAVYNYITKDVKYSFTSFLNTRFVPKDPANTCSAKIGDCKDVAAVMVTMLRRLNIDAWFTLVKTNQMNYFNLVPSLTFDHAIVGYELNGKINYLDLTTDYYPFEVLTQSDNNAWSLLIKEGEKEIKRLPDDLLSVEKNLITMNIQVDVKSDRSAKIKVKATFPGISGGDIREEISRTSNVKQKDYLKELFGVGVFQNLTVDSFHFENMKEFSQPLVGYFEMTTTKYADEVSNLFIIRMPYMIGIPMSNAINTNVRHNRLKLESVLNIQPVKQNISMTFPAGYNLTELPDKISSTNKYGKYEVQFKRTNNGIEIEKMQKFNQNIIEIDEFQSFKNHYLELLDLDNKKIAIQRKAKN